MSSTPTLPPLPTPPTAPAMPHVPLGRRIVVRASSMVLMLSALILLTVVVAAALGVRFRVERTGSMAPSLKAGDLIALKSVAVSSVRPGQVIGVRDPQGAVIVHRVLEIAPTKHHRYAVYTRGDANPTGEHWAIAGNKPVALVVGKLPFVGTAVTHMRGVVAALIVLLAGLALAALQLKSFRKPS